MLDQSARDYRDVLRDCLARRCQANPRYSLRAFARDIGVSAGQLSSIFSGRKGISLASAKKILDQLGSTERETEVYLLQIQRDFSRSKKARDEATSELNKHLIDLRSKQLSTDHFSAMADWYHMAIIQLLRTKNSVVQTDKAADWISKQLGIRPIEAKTAIARLIRLQLLQLKGKELTVCYDFVSSPDGIPLESLREFHRQIIKKAAQAVDLQTVKERYLNAIVFPIRSESVKEIQKDILSFQKQMMTKYGRTNNGDGHCVYALAQQFFRLSEGQK